MNRRLISLCATSCRSLPCDAGETCLRTENHVPQLVPVTVISTRACRSCCSPMTLIVISQWAIINLSIAGAALFCRHFHSIEQVVCSSAVWRQNWQRWTPPAIMLATEVMMTLPPMWRKLMYMRYCAGNRGKKTVPQPGKATKVPAKSKKPVRGCGQSAHRSLWWTGSFLRHVVPACSFWDMVYAVSEVRHDVRNAATKSPNPHPPFGLTNSSLAQHVPSSSNSP